MLTVESFCSTDSESKAGPHHVWTPVRADLAILQVGSAVLKQTTAYQDCKGVHNADNLGLTYSAGSTARYFAAVVPLLNALR